MQPKTSISKPDERLLRYLLAFGILLALLCLGYFEENWRGKHAWARIKRELEAKGALIDWTNYIPATIPESQNFFDAPSMQSWFVGRGGNDLTARLTGTRDSFLAQHNGDVVANVTIVQRDETFTPADADIILNYDSALETVTLQPSGTTEFFGSKAEVMPLIIVDEVSLPDVIKNFARAAGLNYVFQPVGPQPQPFLSARWTNITVGQALGKLLRQQKLRFEPDSRTGIGRFIARDASHPGIFSESAATDRLKKLLESAVSAATNDFAGQSFHTAQGLSLVAGELHPIKPVRVLVRADGIPSTNEIAEFFPALPTPYYTWVNSRAQVQPMCSNSFQVRLNPAAYVSAADYAAWSDTFAPDFDLIRAALKRPGARMNGDYTDPVSQPIPNFVCVRLLAQTLSDRAKCHLLLGQPDAALSDLTLLRDMCRLLESRPNTLVATMIDSAVTSLYTEAIAEGMRLRAWREPQLAALQKQLGSVNLLPLLAQSLALERASVCHLLETMKSDEFEKIFYVKPAANFWQKLKDPLYLAFQAGPRGWVYQNMTTIARLNQKQLDSFDLTNRVVSASRSDDATRQMLDKLRGFSPYTCFANLALPNFSRAVQTLARNQCLADEARCACAAERYRLAHGEYPKTLAALVPEFLESIPTDIISGHPLKYHNAGAQFVLYSVGWNEKDDGGVTGPKKDGEPDLKQGDWVWAAPAR